MNGFRNPDAKLPLSDDDYFELWQLKAPKRIRKADLATALGGGGSMVYPGAGIPLSTGTAWGTSITDNSAHWNSAYGWGNHAAAGYLTSFTETDPVFLASAAHGITSGNITNWNSAYGWGNHAAAGYLTSFTETDPVFLASAAHGITSGNITNWNSAFGWGNWASNFGTTAGTIAQGNDSRIINGQTAFGWGNHAAAGYLTSFTETDPTVPTLVKSIPVSADAATNKYLNWNGSAYVRKQIPYSDISGAPGAAVSSVFGRTGAVVAVAGDYGPTLGGTGLTSYAVGDLLYASAINTLAKLAAGTNGYVLTLAAGLPTWAASSGGGGWGLTGNSGTTPGTNFIGTTDAKNFQIFTNNTLRHDYSSASGSTHWGTLTIYDNTYNFLQYRRSIPNDIPVFRLYAIGDFNPVVFETAGYQFLKYSRGYNNQMLGHGLPTTLTDNDGTETFNATISTNLCIYNGTSTPTLDFWSPYAAQSRRARIGTYDNNTYAARAGDLYFSVNPGTIGGLSEVMRLKPSLNVLIGTTTDIASSILTLTSTTKGFLTPRMTTTQGNAIASPAEGLEHYDTTLHVWRGRNNSVWNHFLYSDVAMAKITAAAPYTNDGYVSVNIGGTVYKLMTTA
jgi:hypothetical protein